MKRVLITRRREDASVFAQALNEIETEAIFFPTIDISPVGDTTTLDRAIIQLHAYDWLVLTSAHVTEIILNRKAALGIEQFPRNLKIAAIGIKTAAGLFAQRIEPDFIPNEYTAESILPGLGELTDRWVLLPMADIAHETLPKAIQRADGIAHVITAYHTLPATTDPEGLAAIQDGLEVIAFTSGSTARNLVFLLQREGLDPFHLPGNPKIACIGPKTAQTARENGFTVDIVADTHTVEGLVQAIDLYLKRTDSHDET